jgi:hypothetical protein
VFGTAHHLTSSRRDRLSRFAFAHNSLSCAAFVIEFAGILLTAMATGAAHDYVAYGYSESLQTYFSIGSMTALAYCMAFLVRDEYRLESLVDGYRTPGRHFLAWNLVFVALAVIGFLTNGTESDSNGWLVLFYFTGSASVLFLNVAIVRALRLLISQGLVRTRRLMVVATEPDFDALEQEIAGSAPGFAIAARIIIEKAGPDADEIKKALDAAVANARTTGIEDIFISDALSHHAFLDRTVEAFSALPVSVHRGAGGLIGRFKRARVLRFGTTAARSLTRLPAAPLETMTKRWFDIVVSAVALVLLSPLFAVIALLIKCESPGPVLLKRRRRGYNTDESRIWKFRTTAVEDGETVQRGTRGAARVTSVGAFLRRFSLDELPQLVNVLKGEMPLAARRPHAGAHDRLYIDNGSLGLDLYILLLRLISPKANHNVR